MASTRDHPLDNVVWTALTTAHSSLATGHGLARHYPRDMAPFSAVAEPTARAYADLIDGLPPEGEARLFRPGDEAAPPGWETLSVRPIIQMVAGDANAEHAPPPALPVVETLTMDDAAAMLALAEVTKPGPFGPRTALLGDYIGVRDPHGRLVAMAGERFRLPGYTELSAISVHPDARRRGLGHVLTLELMRRAFRRGELPFLHVFPDNPAASLYAQLGFRERTRPYVIWRRPIRRAGAAGR